MCSYAIVGTQEVEERVEHATLGCSVFRAKAVDIMGPILTTCRWPQKSSRSIWVRCIRLQSSVLSLEGTMEHKILVILAYSQKCFSSLKGLD